MMDRKMVNFIKEQYPPGTRIRLNSMEDPYAPILPGTEGEVDFVDDAGQLHMKWDNGRSLALIPGEDSFTVLPPKLTTLKLYTLNVIDAMSYQEWQYQTSRGISATLALGPGRALILADLPDSFMTIIILAGSTDGLTRDLLEELADSFDLSKLTPIVLPESLYIPSP